MTAPDRKRLTVAILALGGQGGGVLADWILDVAAHNGYRAQGTSVPGVAQRTGTTVYYIEMIPDVAGPEPVLALTPIPGDVDVVIASELMETGRAIVRGFVTNDRTTLIGSTHRIYAISEKSAMGDGLANSDKVIEAAKGRAKRFIAFDMEEASARCGSVISSVMLGALAGSDALPFPQESFEAAIRSSGIAVEANLRGFKTGIQGALSPVTLPKNRKNDLPSATTPAGRALEARIAAELPASARTLALHGVRRLMDYQDAAYADLYLDRLSAISRLDNGRADFALTQSVARHLALRMSFEDTIRVADLKTRASRVSRVRNEIGVKADQLIGVTEFMHPRLREVCETFPAGIGARILKSVRLTRLLTPLFSKGRHVETTTLRWFLILAALASLRRWRRGTLRYREEQNRISAWLALLTRTIPIDPDTALELSECQRLIKGYGDTFERGLRNYETIVAIYNRLHSRSDIAKIIRQAREAALKDEDGKELAEMGRMLAHAA